MRRPLLLVPPLLVGLAAVGYWAVQTQPVAELADLEPTTPPRSGGPLEPAEAELHEASQAPQLVPPVAEGGEREAVQGQLAVRVADEAGRPLPGALLSLGGALETASAPELWNAAACDAVYEGIEWATTDREGHAAFDVSTAELAGESDGILWATLEGYGARALRLADSLEGGSLSLTLPAASEGARVRVVDAASEPRAGATVYMVGLGAGALRRVSSLYVYPSALDEELQRGLLRRVAVDEAGNCALPVGAAPCLVFAAVEGEQTEYGLATAGGDEVVLHLGGRHLRVQGRLEAAPDVTLLDALVKCHWLEGTEARLLASARVGEDLAWRMDDLVFPDAGTLRFSVFAEGVFSTPALFPVAELGRELTLTLPVEVGVEQRVRVLDSRGEPIDGARVRVFWQEGEQWPYVEAFTKNGEALVRGCKPTTCWLRAEAEGYLSQTSSPTPLPWSDTVELVLGQVEVLRGRVVFGDEPVEDFNLHYWTDGVTGVHTQSFHDRGEGAFELEVDLAVPLHVVASAEDFAESEVLEVVRSDAEVVLELSGGRRASGVVVDALTREPIAGASVRRIATHGGLQLGKVGEAQRTTPDGRFELRGVNALESMVAVNSPGYLEGLVRGVSVGGDEVSFGEVGLTRGQDLVVRVHEGGEAPTETWWFRGQGTNEVPIVQVPASGQYVAQGVAPGGYTFELLHGNGQVLVQDTWLELGEPWELDFDVSARKSLRVKLDIAEGLDTSGGLFVSAEYRNPDGSAGYRSAMWLEADEVRIDGLSGEEVYLGAFSGSTLADWGRAWVSIAGPGPHETVLEVREPDVRLQLTGELVEDAARSQLSLQVAGPDWVRPEALQPDAQGGVAIPHPGSDSAFVTYTHPTQGLRWTTLDLSDREAEVYVLEFPDAAGVALDVRDGDLPLAGVRWALAPEKALRPVHFGVSEASGALGLPRLQSGACRFELSRPDCWPAEIDFEVIPGATTLQLRRRGDLELQLVGPGGAPRAGYSVVLTDETSGETVNSWLDEGRLDAASTNLTSDASGWIRAARVPHGTYTCRLAADPAPSTALLVAPGKVGRGTWTLED